MSNIVKLCADCMLLEGHTIDESEALTELTICYACGKRIGGKTPFQAYIIWRNGEPDGISVEVTIDE
jgi:hypothetical protein